VPHPVRLFGDRYYLLPAVALVLFGTVLGVQVEPYLSDDDLRTQAKKLKEALVTIEQYHVDGASSDDIVAAGIEGMVEDLDPHSSYISAERMQDLRDRYEGSFGGIGISFEVPDDTAQVVSPLPGGPSQRAGVQAGDRIISVEDSSAIGVSSTRLQDRLKGPVGTDVSFTVYRPLSGTRLTFTIKREEVSYRTVPVSYMIDDRTGYIRIARFAKSTYGEFMDAVGPLKEKGMERLVLDLRGNRGGVMEAAVQIADEMLSEDGTPIVETRFRRAAQNKKYRASSGGSLATEPITVLVDQGTASASEILTGALQDNDRALVVGRRTFGKALVQKPFGLPDGAALQLTVGRYYTPVGRLIQTPYEEGNADAYYDDKTASLEDAIYDIEAYRRSVPDSLRYTTEHGRTVFGGGGLLPDKTVEPDTSSLRGYVRQSGLAQLFARQWFSTHEKALRNAWQKREEAFRSEYRVPDSLVAAFWDYAEEEGNLSLTSETVRPEAPHVFLETAARAADEHVATRIKGYLAGTLYGSGAARPILNEIDPVVRDALDSWSASEALAAYHARSLGEGEE